MKQNNYSDRVITLAISTLKKILFLKGYENVDDRILNIIIDNCEFKKIDSKIAAYSQIKHSGKYGPLNKLIQNKLNLLLLAYDLVGKSQKDKKNLVLKYITKNDAYLKNKKAKQIESNIIKEMIKEIDDYDYKFKNFIFKVDSLFVIRKYELKKIVEDNKKYQVCVEEITAIFKEHIAKAITLQNDKFLKNSSTDSIKNQNA